MARLVRIAILLGLCTAAIDAQVPAAPRGVIRGSVTDSLGRPIADAELLLRDTHLAARTRDDGHFEFPPTAPAIYVITTRKLGFAPATFSFRLIDTVSLDIQMSQASTTLPVIVVNGETKRANPKLVGFYERMRTSGAPRSSFITREEIEKRAPWRTSDLIRDRGSRAVTCLSGMIYLDGALMPQRSPFDPPPGKRRTVPDSRSAIDIITPPEIDAIENYRGPATTPAEFNATASPGQPPGCVILVWTR